MASFKRLIDDHNYRTTAARAAGAIQDARRMLPHLSPDERAYIVELASALIEDATDMEWRAFGAALDRVR
jgi:hypothetical protein